MLVVCFPVSVHKPAQFLNAHIDAVGIRGRSYELPAAMLLKETACGLKTLVAAPMHYTGLALVMRAYGLA